jgi:long-chain acyl-CoA synthetase
VHNLDAVINDNDFKKVVMDDLEQLGKSNKLSSLEKPKDILLTTEPFSIENNILTPTFKLKRNVGRDIYKKQIDAMYVELHKKGF